MVMTAGAPSPYRPQGAPSPSPSPRLVRVSAPRSASVASMVGQPQQADALRNWKERNANDSLKRVEELRRMDHAKKRQNARKLRKRMELEANKRSKEEAELAEWRARLNAMEPDVPVDATKGISGNSGNTKRIADMQAKTAKISKVAASGEEKQARKQSMMIRQLEKLVAEEQEAVRGAHACADRKAMQTKQQYDDELSQEIVKRKRGAIENQNRMHANFDEMTAMDDERARQTEERDAMEVKRIELFREVREKAMARAAVKAQNQLKEVQTNHKRNWQNEMSSRRDILSLREEARDEMLVRRGQEQQIELAKKREILGEKRQIVVANKEELHLINENLLVERRRFMEAQDSKDQRLQEEETANLRKLNADRDKKRAEVVALMNVEAADAEEDALRQIEDAERRLQERLDVLRSQKNAELATKKSKFQKSHAEKRRFREEEEEERAEIRTLFLQNLQEKEWRAQEAERATRESAARRGEEREKNTANVLARVAADEENARSVVEERLKYKEFVAEERLEQMRARKDAEHEAQGKHKWNDHAAKREKMMDQQELIRKRLYEKDEVIAEHVAQLESRKQLALREKKRKKELDVEEANARKRAAYDDNMNKLEEQMEASEGVAAERMGKLQKAREATRDKQKNDVSERRKIREEEQTAFEEEFNTMLQERIQYEDARLEMMREENQLELDKSKLQLEKKIKRASERCKEAYESKQAQQELVLSYKEEMIATQKTKLAKASEEKLVLKKEQAIDKQRSAQSERLHDEIELEERKVYMMDVMKREERQAQIVRESRAVEGAARLRDLDARRDENVLNRAVRLEERKLRYEQTLQEGEERSTKQLAALEVKRSEDLERRKMDMQSKLEYLRRRREEEEAVADQLAEDKATYKQELSMARTERKMISRLVASTDGRSQGTRTRAFTVKENQLKMQLEALVTRRQEYEKRTHMYESALEERKRNQLSNEEKPADV